MTQHNGEIVSGQLGSQSGFLGSGWVARCSCGWQGQAHSSDADAVHEMAAHHAAVAEPKTIDEHLTEALAPLHAEVEQAEDSQSLYYIGARLTEVETKIELAFGQLRQKVQERLAYVTGRGKGQG